VLQFGKFFNVYIGCSVIKSFKMLFVMFNQIYYVIDYVYAIGTEISICLVVGCLNATFFSSFFKYELG
jgi:hypothetical protein